MQRKKSKERMIHFCVEVWGGEEIRKYVIWPMFGTFERWVCRALTIYVGDKLTWEGGEGEEYEYTKMWERADITIYPMKIGNPHNPGRYVGTLGQPSTPVSESLSPASTSSGSPTDAPCTSSPTLADIPNPSGGGFVTSARTADPTGGTATSARTNPEAANPADSSTASATPSHPAPGTPPTGAGLGILSQPLPPGKQKLAESHLHPTSQENMVKIEKDGRGR